MWVALGANLAIALAKVVGGLITASPALLSEAAHSVADSCNEVFLLAAIRRSKRAPDARHPFGYGKERYFWSLLAAVGIFVMGGCFSFYQGLHALRETSSESPSDYLVGYAVLGVALLAEGASLVRAVRQMYREAPPGARGPLAKARSVDDPALRTVLAEDGTAVLGVVLALIGMGLHELTGNVVWEGSASIGIGLLLVFVAYRLGIASRDQLIGEAAEPGLQLALRQFLDEQDEVDTVARLYTMRIGMGQILLAARVDLTAGVDSEAVEDAAERIKEQIHERWPEIEQVFLDITDAGEGERESAARRRRELEEQVRVAEHEG
ncbi:cation diffusion facilitator family transporter [Streptomyces sp. SID3343]|uniref:cation diffusion facilitator family transporter n=1 Tax=Streptomyces sp. SID3343 TaxID=2690260 RepID=UPI0031F7CC8A